MSVLLKVVISALLIGAIAEISRRSTAVAALLASLPLVSLIAMIWIYHDTHDVTRIAAFSMSIFWYVLPSLILFALLPTLLLRWHVSFYPALLIASAATIAGFFLLKAILRPFGIVL
jgi:hypothetical protein